MKEVKIFSLMFFPPANQFVLTLVEETESRIIPIWIGVAEGNILRMKIKNLKTQRPLTHDLIGSIFEECNISPQKIIINDLNNNTYYALIDLSRGEKTRMIDARPSDAIVLSVIKNIPIFIEEKVLAQCPLIPKPISDTDVSQFKQELSKLK